MADHELRDPEVEAFYTPPQENGPNTSLFLDILRNHCSEEDGKILCASKENCSKVGHYHRKAFEKNYLPSCMGEPINSRQIITKKEIKKIISRAESEVAIFLSVIMSGIFLITLSIGFIFFNTASLWPLNQYRKLFKKSC